MDDAVREHHGVSCREGDNEKRSSISIWEGESLVHIDGNYTSRHLTEWQARYLAAKLYRLSRRIRARRDEREAEAGGGK